MRRAGVILGLFGFVEPVLAHTTGRTHSESSPLPLVLVLTGALVLGTALVLYRRTALTRSQAVVGGGLGSVGLLAGLALQTV